MQLLLVLTRMEYYTILLLETAYVMWNCIFFFTYQMYLLMWSLLDLPNHNKFYEYPCHETWAPFSLMARVSIGTTEQGK